MICPICFGDDKNKLITLECSHSIHTDCLEATFKQGYKDEDIKKFACLTCGKAMSDKFIFEKLGLEYLTLKSDVDFILFQNTQSNSIVCMDCKNLHIYDTANPPKQFIKCHNCQKDICIKCRADAHPLVPECMENLRKLQAKNSKLTFCPKCMILYNKISGCNHMTCNKCKQSFCAICSISLHGSYDHFNKIGTKCFGKQNSDF